MLYFHLFYEVNALEFVFSCSHPCSIGEMPGGRLVGHLEVCDRKMASTSSIKNARGGNRRCKPERNAATDWKARLAPCGLGGKHAN